MPDRVEVFDITCPASTPASNPLEIDFNYAPGIPRRVTIIIPDGHAGLTGIALGYGHQPVLPRSANAFISSNDEHITFDLHGYPGGPLWQAFVCNNDTISHVWEIILEVDEIPASNNTSIAQAPIPPSEIVSAGAQQMTQDNQSASVSVTE